jgi:hypothetical protein
MFPHAHAPRYVRGAGVSMGKSSLQSHDPSQGRAASLCPERGVNNCPCCNLKALTGTCRVHYYVTSLRFLGQVTSHSLYQMPVD